MRSTRLQEIKPERSVQICCVCTVESCDNIKLSNSFCQEASQSNASKELTAAIRYCLIPLLFMYRVHGTFACALRTFFLLRTPRLAKSYIATAIGFNSECA